MFNIIVTGFEPFDGAEKNASWEAVKALPDTIGAFTLHKMELPVVFNQAAQTLLTPAIKIDPCWILCVGEARGAGAITIERFAHNLQYAERPDNLGRMPQNRRCVQEGALAMESRHPIFEQRSAIQKEDIPVRISTSAGTYVCNDLFYQVLYHYDVVPTRAGFIHVPEIGNAAGISVEDMTRALQAAIEVL